VGSIRTLTFHESNHCHNFAMNVQRKQFLKLFTVAEAGWLAELLLNVIYSAHDCVSISDA